MLALVPALLFLGKGPGIAVLCYHDLQPVAKNDMTNTPGNFEAHLQWLKSHGYQTISLNQLVSGMQERSKLPPKSIILTFDDGYAGVYRYAYPLLKKYGFTGTLFLVTSKMGDLSGDMPHLTWPQIEEMDHQGVIRAEVHANRLHIKLGQRLRAEQAKGLVPTDVKNDLAEAKSQIEAHIHRRVDFVAWPYGDYNQDLVRIAAGLGYKAMISTEYGLNYSGDNIRDIKRLRMSSGYDNLKRFEQKLAHYNLH